MIKEIKIKNFQSHKDSCITLTEGLNCIIGSTNVGKSSFVRALRWVLFNDYYKNFTTWGEGFSEVTVKLYNNSEIIRYRDSKTNRYTLIKDNNTQNFDNFGDTIPIEIRTELKYAELKLDKDQKFNLNARSQHDPLFLLSNTYTDSLKAKALNSLIGINILDNTIRGYNSDKLNIGRDKKRIDDDIICLQKEIESFNDLGDQENKLFNLQNLFSKIKDLKIKFDKLDYLKNELKNYRIKVSNWKDKNKNIRKYDKNCLDKLIACIDKYKKLSNLFEFLNKYMLGLNRVHSSQSTLKNELNTIKLKYKELLINLKQCPLCLSFIDENKAEEISKKL